MLVTSNGASHTDHKTDSVDHKPLLPFVIGKLESEIQNLELGATTRLTQIEIIWIKKGRGDLIADFSTVAFDGNIIFCLAPGVQRRIVTDTELHGYYLSLSTDFLRLSEGQTHSSILSAQHVRVSRFVVLEPDKDLAYEMTDVISKMIKEYSNYYLLRSEILKGLVKVFAIYLTRNTNPNLSAAVTGRDSEMVNRFMTLVSMHFATKKKVSEYADELCVTPNYLNQMVKRATGFPASYHIQQQIVLEAKRQAASSGLRMKEIADALGFQDYAHFSKFFKTYSGISFSNFKSALTT